MYFNRRTHTVEFLENNTDVLMNLASESKDFATSDQAQNERLLRLKISDDGRTAAHILAKYQPEWMYSRAAQQREILSIDTSKGWNDGWSVAHELAASQLDWINLPIINDEKILLLKDRSDISVAQVLARENRRFLQTKYANSKEILKLSSDFGRSIAHELAKNNSEWLKHHLSKDFEILSLDNCTGDSVAHYLAMYQNEWSSSQQSKMIDILSLCNQNMESVAHYLARYSSSWITVEIDVLKFTSNIGKTVAHELAEKSPSWSKSEASFNKEILSLCYRQINRFKSVAECMVKNDSFPSLSEVITRMVSRGAAYKHSTSINECYFLQECYFNIDKLLQDELEPKVRIKIACAYYSTLSNFKDQLDSRDKDYDSNKKLELISLLDDYLEHAENNFIKVLSENAKDITESELIELCSDINCNAGKNFVLKKLASRNFEDKLEFNDFNFYNENSTGSKNFVY
jgi:hypothetical protein